MRRTFSRTQFLFPGLVFLALLLFYVPETQVENLRGRALSALSPILRIFSEIRNHGGPWEASVRIPIHQEDAAGAEPPPPLNQAGEVDRLRDELARLRSEVRRLQSLLPNPSAPLHLPPGIAADVIARKNLWQEPLLGLDRGEAEGVQLHAGVLHRGAVLGRVISVGPHASSMALLTHKAMSITARLSESRLEGKLQGAREEQGERLCRMFVVARELNVKPGENVVTSGLDGSFPPGLWLGVVAGVQKTADFQWEIAVRPACNEHAVEAVHVLTVKPPEVPWPSMPERLRGAAKGARR